MSAQANLRVFVCPGGRFATWQTESGACGSILMQAGEAIHEAFSRAMDEERTHAKNHLKQAERFKNFSVQAYAELQLSTSNKARK